MNLLSKLKKSIKQAKKAKFYSQRLDSISEESISSIEDFEKIPLTHKDDLRSVSETKDLLACSEECIAQVNTTSGTTGKPTFSFFSHQDLKKGSESLEKAWRQFGVSEESRVQFIMSFGLFSGASLNSIALKHLGAAVIPAGIQSLEKQLELISDFRPDTLVATPSFYMHLFHTLEEKGRLEVLEDWSVERGVAAGEVYSDQLRKVMEDNLGIAIHNHYGLCELYSGFAYECECRSGLHTLKNLVYPEIIDPETGDVVDDGNWGELVITSLSQEGSPILRYATGDITRRFKTKEICECQEASNSVYMIDWIRKRKNDSFFIKGIEINPYHTRNKIIDHFHNEIRHDLQFVLSENRDFTTPKIYISPKRPASSDIKEQIEDFLKSELSISFSVQQKPDEYFNRKSRNKAKLVIYE